MAMKRTSLLLIAVMAATACGPTTGNNSGAVSPPPVTATMPEPEITLAEYDQIKSGMTYEQVSEIVGVAGEVKSEFKAIPTPGLPDMSTKTYEYRGAGIASAQVTFQGGKVNTTMQFGLK